MQRKGECLFAYDAHVVFHIQLSLTRTSIQRPLYRHDNVLVPTLKAVGIIIAVVLYRHDKMLVMLQIQFRLTMIANIIF